MRNKRPQDWDGPVPERGIAGPLFALPPDFPAQRDPWDRTGELPDEEELAVGTYIWRFQGWQHPVAIDRVAHVTGFNERKVKQVVERLRTKHLCLIGARREEPAGYFWITCEEDRRQAVKPYRNQVLAMFNTLLVLDTPEQNKDLLVQMGRKL